MLNPGFSAQLDAAYGSNYVVPASLREALVEANRDLSAGAELRTQAVYGDELWFRMQELGLDEVDWGTSRVLDACCGSGFLSYHLVQRVLPKDLTLVDVSAEEVAAAAALIGRSDVPITSACADLADVEHIPGPFDVVVGNSFLHHFPDVPSVLRSIFELVRPGGLFAGLHEPTPAALVWESRDPRVMAAYWLSRRRFLQRIRYRDGVVRPGTTDVWIFDPDDLRRMLEDAGFVDVKVVQRYLLRPFVVALLRMHLSPTKPRLSPLESRILALAVRADALLRRVLPSGAFGGLSFLARRPA